MADDDPSVTLYPDSKATGLEITSKREVVVDRHRLYFEGLFVIQDLYKQIDEYFEEKGYDKVEKRNAEVVRDDGQRFLDILIEPYKKLTDYAKCIIRLRILMENVKQLEIEKEGLKVMAHEGKLSFVYSAYLDTDYENRWSSNMVYNAIRILYDKFFMKEYTQQYKAEINDDLNMLIYQIKAYLNMLKS